MNPKNDVTQLIERLEAFEERCEIRLEALFAIMVNYDDGDYRVGVNGELHPNEGTNLKQEITLRVDVYDKAGRLIARGDEQFLREDFFGFRTFSIDAMVRTTEKPSKIRVYPTIP
jgi:hypothetical protein